jgi:hypothetical protein
MAPAKNNSTKGQKYFWHVRMYTFSRKTGTRTYLHTHALHKRHGGPAPCTGSCPAAPPQDTHKHIQVHAHT